MKFTTKRRKEGSNSIKQFYGLKNRSSGVTKLVVYYHWPMLMLWKIIDQSLPIQVQA